MAQDIYDKKLDYNEILGYKEELRLYCTLQSSVSNSALSELL
jgi:hypothetical protein